MKFTKMHRSLMQPGEKIEELKLMRGVKRNIPALVPLDTWYPQ